MSRTLRYLLTISLLVIFAGNVRAEKLTNEKILNNFNLVAFGNEYTLKRYKNVRKWSGPIRIGIQGKKHPAYFEAYVKQHIRDLWTITHHPTELYYSYVMQKTGELAKDFDPKKVNFILYFLPVSEIPAAVGKHFTASEDEIGKMIRTSQCFAKYYTRKNEIVKAIAVFMDHTSRKEIRECVVEEITQVLGLANDSDKVNPSIFNDRSPYKELTEHDRWMLRMFYDPRITVGMEREQAIAMGRKILNEIRPE
jgi:hypothetical protein